MVRKVGTVKWKPGGHPLSGSLEWSLLHGSETPGPGAYDVRQSERVPGGKFVGFGKTHLEETIYNKKDIPGPAAYPPVTIGRSKTGGLMSRAQIPTFVDQEQTRAGSIPAPGQYWKAPHQAGGCRWGHSVSETAMDVLVRRSRESPAPWDYATVEPHLLPGGRWSISKSKSELDWKLYYASAIPPPGHYGMLPVPGGVPAGGRLGNGRNISALDRLTARTAAVPGPGMYNVEDSYEKTFFRDKDRWLRTGRLADSMDKMEAMEASGRSSLAQTTEVLRGPTVKSTITDLQSRYSEFSGRQSRSRAGGEFGISQRSTRHMIGDYQDLPPNLPLPRLLPG